MQEHVRLSVEHVSDTAFMVAAFRARESERPDACFHDPFAGRLAGEKAAEVLKDFPVRELGEWMLTVRTVALDRLILKAIEEGTDTVLNLATGLDTRPYRLQNLPSALRWIEADFEGIIDYKTDKLKNETPHCHLERVKIDLRDGAARLKFFEDINDFSKNVLVITEGLLGYLTEGNVVELSRDLLSQENFRAWLMDMVTPDFMNDFKERLKKQTATNDGVAFHFVPEEGAEFFTKHGWKIEEFRSFAAEGKQIHREFNFLKIENESLNKGIATSGISLLVPKNRAPQFDL